MPTIVKFTKNELLSLKPQIKRKRYKDNKVDGLILEVLPSGKKTFRVYKRIKGKPSPSNISIGSFPDLSIENARIKARGILNDMAIGIDPNAEIHKAKIRSITLKEAYNDYKNSKSLKELTIKGYEQALSLYLRKFIDTPLENISEKDCRQLHKDICEGKIKGMRKPSPAQANLCMRFLKAIYNFAAKFYKSKEGEKVFNFNPVLTLNELGLIKEVQRKTSFLDKSSLKKFYGAILSFREECKSKRYSYGETVCDYLEMMLLTGLRKVELMELRWENVDLSNKCFMVKGTKNGSDLELPLSERVLEILTCRKVSSSESPFVFNADNKKGRIVEPKKVIKNICETAGITFALHDLRRTYSSYAEEVGVGQYSIKRLLNHKTQKSDVTASYIQFNYGQLRVPSQKIEDFILSIALSKNDESNNEPNAQYINDFISSLSITGREALIKSLSIHQV